MESEVIFFALAKWLIDEHGADASAQAIRFTQEAMQENDALASANWRTVRQAIALQANASAATRH
jgi:hypothetical protein